MRCLNGLVKYVIVRAEVMRALRRGDLSSTECPGPDSVCPSAIPSTLTHGMGNRVLAEVDQDGFTFALNPSDAAVFNRRRQKLRRNRYQLDIVLRGGLVCLRKQFLPVPLSHGLSSWFWNRLGMAFYTSVAAYVRLQDLAIVPRIRDIDFVSRSIYMDYIFGENLKQHLGHNGIPIHDLDLAAAPELSCLSDTERQARETRIFVDRCGHTFRDEIKQMILEMNRRGVAPFDIKLGNIVQGDRTGRLYWVDLERAQLRSQPHWDDMLREQYGLLNQSFDLQLVGGQQGR
jgi:hypothetical protein